MCIREFSQVECRRKRKFKAYKIITRDGRPDIMGGNLYGPGVCVPKSPHATTVEQYYSFYTDEPYVKHTALHVLRNKKAVASWMHPSSTSVIIEVIVDPADVIVADKEQMAVTKLTITPEAWVNAGFAPKKTQRRTI